MNRFLKGLFLGTGLLFSHFATALTFPLPTSGDDIIGQAQIIQTVGKETIYQIAQQYDMGFYEMVEANPAIYRHSEIPPQQTVHIPSEFILPDVPREGIVVNLPELRLYYYPKGENTVITYPLAIGRYEWITPTINTKVVEKQKDPSWFVPKSIQAAAAQKGIIWPDVVPAGPKNPLGKYALRLGDRSYLIHGTNNPKSIGKRASSGCMRMYPDDIETLFNTVPVGTRVRIVNEWYKLGWNHGLLYLEIHEPLQETAMPKREERLVLRTRLLEIAGKYNVVINWDAAMKALEEQSGMPVQISSHPVSIPSSEALFEIDDESLASNHPKLKGLN